MAKNIFIAFISNYFDIGGVQRTILAIANSLQDRGFTFHFVNLGNDTFLDGFRQCGACFHSASPSDVIGYLQKNKIGVVQTNNCDAGSYLAYIAGVPRIIERLAGMNSAFLFDKAPVDCIIGSTDNVTSQARAMYPHKYVARIYNGVDLSVFSPAEKERALMNELGIQPDELVIGYCGRISREKCIDKLLGVFQRVSERRNTKLVLLGDFIEDAYAHRIHDAVRDMNLEAKVVFTGGTDNPSAVMNLFDIGVLTSGTHVLPDGAEWVTKEGLSNAVMEMLAMGIPVVATSSGETGSLVKDQLTGYLVDMDDMDTFSEKLSYLIENKELRKRMGENAREFVRNNFSRDAMLSEYEKFYQYVVSEQLMADYPDRRKDMDTHFLAKSFEWNSSPAKNAKILVIRSGSKALCDCLINDINRNFFMPELDILCHSKSQPETVVYPHLNSVYAYDKTDTFALENMQDIIARINAKRYDYLFFLSNNFMGKGQDNMAAIVNAVQSHKKIVLTGLKKMYVWA
ncbi:MAG: glycosyltransferase family 4 protein [Candidatus Auribacterota bacterium]